MVPSPAPSRPLPRLSIVAPSYNERANIRPLAHAVAAAWATSRGS
ncbi:hypothetical protein [Sphingomonas rubra]|uniref:Glycosyl transferase family 2 n=1 Tax=Sphingomonas rubra TaxID=634430 RepID=A0A1I5QNN8_9SPHN|nr:hypothetical protein [Sphingomonas rubra]SFP47476.1 hypothetical protein SAMN04488241_102162 [Sphingomonas rubra]